MDAISFAIPLSVFCIRATSSLPTASKGTAGRSTILKQPLEQQVVTKKRDLQKEMSAAVTYKKKKLPKSAFQYQPTST